VELVDGMPRYTETELKRVARLVEEEARWRTAVILTQMANDAMKTTRKTKVQTPGRGRYTDRPE
jgi:hypothetical protein